MASLTGRKPKDTYTWLLQAGAAGPLTGTPRAICLGDGSATPLSISDATLFVDGAIAMGGGGWDGSIFSGSQTFTGQVELDAQAATNPTSAMTRGLGDARYKRRPVILDADFSKTSSAAYSDVPMASSANHPEALSVFGVTLAANETASFHLILRVDEAGGTRNQNYKFVGPSGSSWIGTLYATGSGGTAATYAYGAADVLANRLATANANGIVVLSGVVSNGATAGNFVLQFAQGSSSAVAITLKKGSSFTINRP